MPSPLSITQDDLNRATDIIVEVNNILINGAEVSGHGSPDIPALNPHTGIPSTQLTAFLEAIACAVVRVSRNGASGGEPYPVNLPIFTMATLPSGVLGAIIYVSDATAPPPSGVPGGVCYYDGSNWRRVDNQVVI